MATDEFQMGPARRWFALGDSFTVGTGDDQGGWVVRTVLALAEAGVDIELINLAVEGARIDEVVEHQSPELPPWVDMVSVIAGGNDLLAYVMRPQELASGVTTLLGLAAARGGLVVTSTCPDFFAHRYGAGCRLSRRVALLNDMIRGAADELAGRCLLLDTETVLRDPQLWSDDGIHPNPVGHRELSEVMTGMIRLTLEHRR